MNKMRAFGEIRWKRSLVFNFRFADEHHGDVVANRIHAAALAALQALSAFEGLYWRLAERADQDFQEFRVDGHDVQDLSTNCSGGL